MVGVRPGKGGKEQGTGYRLRHVRETYAISLEQVSLDLHIPMNQLRGLEEEDYSVFSAELYARGAYASYAKYLGIETRGSSNAFSRTLRSVREKIPLRLHTPATLFDRLLNPRIVFIGFGIGAALLVSGYIAWQVQSFWRLPRLSLDAIDSHEIHGSSTVISGSTEPLSRVQINGQSIVLRNNATFSVPISLHPGINALKIEASNTAGRIRTQQIFLLRK